MQYIILDEYYLKYQNLEVQMKYLVMWLLLFISALIVFGFFPQEFLFDPFFPRESVVDFDIYEAVDYNLLQGRNRRSNPFRPRGNDLRFSRIHSSISRFLSCLRF